MSFEISDERQRLGQLHVRASIVAGLAAGCAYLAAQMGFAATVHDGTGWEPLQRISAMLLGPDAASPPGRVSVTIATMALLIHLPLSGIYGRLIGWLVPCFDTRWSPLVGLCAGLAVYGVNFWLIAPGPFPWFEQSRNVVTAFDHAVFGILIAVLQPLIYRRIAA